MSGCDSSTYAIAIYLKRKDEATITEDEYKKWLKDEGLE